MLSKESVPKLSKKEMVSTGMSDENSIARLLSMTAVLMKWKCFSFPRNTWSDGKSAGHDQKRSYFSSPSSQSAAFRQSWRRLRRSNSFWDYNSICSGFDGH